MMDWIFDAALHIFLEQILGFVARDDVIPLSGSHGSRGGRKRQVK